MVSSAVGGWMAAAVRVACAWLPSSPLPPSRPAAHVTAGRRSARSAERRRPRSGRRRRSRRARDCSRCWLATAASLLPCIARQKDTSCRAASVTHRLPHPTPASCRPQKLAEKEERERRRAEAAKAKEEAKRWGRGRTFFSALCLAHGLGEACRSPLPTPATPTTPTHPVRPTHPSPPHRASHSSIPTPPTSQLPAQVPHGGPGAAAGAAGQGGRGGGGGAGRGRGAACVDGPGGVAGGG